MSTDFLNVLFSLSLFHLISFTSQIGDPLTFLMKTSRHNFFYLDPRNLPSTYIRLTIFSLYISDNPNLMNSVNNIKTGQILPKKVKKKTCILLKIYNNEY